MIALRRLFPFALSLFVLSGFAPAQQPAKTTPPSDAKPATVFPQFGKFLAIIEGDYGRGTGSLIKLKGNIPLLVTNAHVLSGNSTFKISLLDGTRINYGKLGVAKGHDVLVMDAAGMTDGMEAMQEVDKNVAIGDRVVVLGNSLGNLVVTEITGNVVGIGPDRIEIDAKFVAGDSGSPVIHVKTGKVIGLATYVQVPKLDEADKDSRFKALDVRRFCYRLDSVKGWNFPPLLKFLNDGVRMAQIRQHGEELVALLSDIWIDGSVELRLHQGERNRMRPIVSEFLKSIERPGMAAQSYQDAKLKFLRAIAFECMQDVNPATYHPTFFADTYHDSEFRRTYSLRKSYKDLVTRFLNIQDTAGKINLP